MANIKHIAPANKVNMGGLFVRQPLPSMGLDMVDPFLLLHHAELSFKSATDESTSGVGPHPHRGFSPVSFVFNGGVHHRDSLGNDSVIYSGGVQWINSGSGIIHSERPPKDLVGSDAPQEFIQLWVNTPAANKMDAPSYQGFTKEELPLITSSDGKIQFSVVSGSFQGKSGPVNSNTDVLSAMIFAEENGSHQITLDSSHHAMLYILKGNVEIDGKQIQGKNLVVFESGETGFELSTLEPTHALLLSGAPIKEPVATYGPFVMNNQQEIIQALNDAHDGKMGELVENF